MEAASNDFAATPTLSGTVTRLEPLAADHADALAEAVAVDELWRTWYTRIPSPEGMRDEIERRRGMQAEGRLAPWAVVDATTGRPVGMTTYLNLDPANRRLEIGSTWLGVDAQRTGINAEAKRLLLARAFEELGCIAVEFRTHWHNHQSRAAIARLGAKQDGVLRKHVIFENGTVRDTVVFSITDDEWPAVRAGLDARLERHARR
ncbi:GNAT family N-acetyltransferase [Agromyces aerolatus]|uniref:GNAT family N-acetyltransferase n=1 Tax=Agromyces sp. LY-1074 TaxID=3074080 RepID=UPI002865DEA9|nr:MULTISPECIES: GNAT family protein [unclassified Agromyces]MDR5701097.1 GNAT family protein [Agromyces sp. LY-1074]MDR5707737.1 GNAT family protein [Agromyces sp. LY-1358]